jgi:hypothetical protein
MLIPKRFWEPIEQGEVTVTFRRWKRSQVVAGRVYRTAAGRLAVEAVDEVTPQEISDDDARRAGYPDADALRRDLRGEEGQPVFRIRFRHLSEPDPRSELADDDALEAEDIAAITARLERLDRASQHGPWTRSYLQAIESNPERRAPDLAGMFGRETQPFKLDVRKLKNLGLTLSCPVGYRLSRRGTAYLAALRQQGA